MFFLLALLLLSVTEFSQLAKLPFLVTHFMEHKRDDATMGLLEYLVMHYDVTAKPDADHARDMTLPFKAPGAYMFSGMTFFLPQPGTGLSSRLIITHTPSLPVMTASLPDNAFRDTIWQPPRSC